MRIVFAHDTVLIRDSVSGKHYSFAMNYRLWNRYLETFDSITLCVRSTDDATSLEFNQFNQVDGERLTIHPIPSINNPLELVCNHSKASKDLREALKHSDGLISRLPSEIGLLAINIAKELGKPYMIEMVGHAMDSLRNHGSPLGKWYAPIMTKRIQNQVKQAPFVTYVTDRFLQKHYPTNGKSIGCSDVEIEHVLPRKRKCFNREKLMTIGMIGSMTNNTKGIDTAIKAIHIASQVHFEIELRILGAGDPTSWRQLSESYGLGKMVSFYSPLPSGEPVFEWLDDIDLYIQPSRQEGLPRALLEAMSRGLPAIGSTIGGIPELLPEDCLIQPDDAPRLSQMIIRAYEDETWLEEQSIRNLQTSNKYLRDQLTRRRKDFWSKFIKESREVEH